jgi:hypothetical protein
MKIIYGIQEITTVKGFYMLTLLPKKLEAKKSFYDVDGDGY